MGLVASCAAANISPHQSRVAFQVTCERFVGYKFLLSPHGDEKDSDQPTSKKPCTKEDYSENYQDVLHSAKTITRMKHLMAIQKEENAALALLDAAHDDVVTVHYDTTTQKRVNGEWPSLILRSSSGKQY